MPTHEFPGVCPICERERTFVCDGDWFRDGLLCTGCLSVVRERALALVLAELLPNWRDLAIHESSASPRGVSLKLSREAKFYVGSQYFKDVQAGAWKEGVRCENLERQTFGDEVFDCVVTLDVMEHVFDPAAVYQEVWRTLRPKGYYIHTFPINKHIAEPFRIRASMGESGEIVHHAEPEYHGNPIDESGALVTHDYGYDISKQIAEWAPFDVRVLRFCDRTHGILGEFTEVVVCRKRAR